MNLKVKEPDYGELHELLNHGFDGWGSREYFDWRYKKFPDYDPEKDNILIYSESGKLIGARRVFVKRLYTPDGEEIPVHIHGGTVVHKDHRGSGHYSDMLARSKEYSEREAHHIFTFNRKGKITTKHHIKNDWSWITLPIYVKIISPSKVLSHQFGSNRSSNIGLDVISSLDKKLTKSDFVSKMVAKLAGSKYGTVPSSSDTSMNGSMEEDHTVSVLPKSKVTDDILQEICEYIDRNKSDVYRFERDTNILKHCIEYPEALVFLARDESEGKLIGFGISGVLDKDGLRECRILEQGWSDPKVGMNLLKEIENRVRSLDVDVMAICSDDFPAERTWIKMDTEYMMWTDIDEAKELPVDAHGWRITIYDVL